MPPKRRDRDAGESSRNGRCDITDYELFLQAFEKPTQIYRYLRTRNMISPLFVNRTLTYMRHRMSRSHTGRKSYKIDSMLDKRLGTRSPDKANVNAWLGEFMTLAFLGFYDKASHECDTIDQSNFVRVETILLKISHKKRKDSSSAFTQMLLGSSDVSVNPSVTDYGPKVPAVSVSAESLKPGVTPLNKTFILLLRVHTLPNTTVPNANNCLVSINGEEPPLKKPKFNVKLYTSELVVFDKHSRCLLTEGEYDLSLQEITSYTSPPKPSSPRKYATWETISESSLEDIEIPDGSFDTFAKCPTLKFRLLWTKERTNGTVERPPPIVIEPELNSIGSADEANKENGPSASLTPSTIAPTLNHNNNNSSTEPVDHNNDLSITLTNGYDGTSKSPSSGMDIVYQFIYNNNSRQPTETCSDFYCPWCSMNCRALYALLKHLKLCHDRFNFTYVPMPNTNGARIDVGFNELYDGSYTGSPNDLVGTSGFVCLRSGPVRRTSVTHILVCRPRRQKPSLVEFLEFDDNELNAQRPYITGHNRLYHHTETCLPVHPKELDIDSEGESDPLWLQHKTMMMIDEFTDVNEGEKELMKMWNLHVMKYGYVGDCQIPIACDMFLDIRGNELLQKNLYRNFVLHMSSLFDYGLISSEVLYKTVQKLQKMLSEYGDGKKALAQARSEQMDFWMKTGILKQQQHEQLKLKQQKSDNCKGGGITSDKKTIDVPGCSSSKSIMSTPPSFTGKMLNGKNSAFCEPMNSKRTKTSSLTKLSLSSLIDSGNTSTMKRKLSQLRESPPRRRSAGAPQTITAPSHSDRQKAPPTRRRSLATVTPLPRKRL